MRGEGISTPRIRCTQRDPFCLFVLKGVVVPQNLPSHFPTRNNNFRLSMIFQTGSRIGQTDFPRQSNKN